MRVLHFHGRRAAAWDTAIHAYGGLPPGTILLSSRHSGTENEDAATSGASWVLADSDLLTLNHPAANPSSPQSPLTARQLADQLPPMLHSERLKGVEAVAWSTSVTTPDLLFYHLLPRLLVVGEIAWHGDDVLYPGSTLLPGRARDGLPETTHPLLDSEAIMKLQGDHE